MPKANADGVAIDYEVRGAGAPLLMICGFRRSRVVWMNGILDLLAQRFQLILMDNRGTGQSDKPQDGYSAERMADDAAAVLAHAQLPRAHVFGFSMGGMIAQRVALRHPGLVHGLALAGTHCGTHGSVPGDKRIFDLLRIVPDAQRTAREVAVMQEQAYFVESFRAANRPLLDRMFDVVNANPTPPHAVQGHLKVIAEFEGCADLGQIKAPTLAIHGDGDPLIPAENSRILAKGIAGAQLYVVPTASHFFWMEKPQESAAALTGFFGKLG
jgi:pimeloyl-ACP methyl ester carboxylesterase